MQEHPNILKHFGNVDVNLGGTKQFRTIWTEVCLGNLRSLFSTDAFKAQSQGQMIATCWDILRQILGGLKACHNNLPPIIHRDIKLTNSTKSPIYLCAKSKIVMYSIALLPDGKPTYLFKIGDFGMARIFLPEQDITPVPSAPDSSHQHAMLSTNNIGLDADLPGVGYIMGQMERRLGFPHPDNGLRKLMFQLQQMECTIVNFF